MLILSNWNPFFNLFGLVDKRFGLNRDCMEERRVEEGGKHLYLLWEQDCALGCVANIESLCCALEGNTSLQSLVITYPLTSPQIALISGFLEMNTTLLLFSIFLRKIDLKDFEIFSKGLQRNSSLTTLSIIDLEGAEQVGYVMEALKGNTRLKQLNLMSKGNNPLDIFYPVIQYVEDNPNLRHLSLTGISSVQCACAFARHLEDNTTLKHIRLINCRIDCKQLKYITKALQKNSSLRHLDLSYNNIKDKGAKQIAQLLKLNKTLTKLNIHLNNIDSLGMNEIFKAMKMNSNIIELEIGEIQEEYYQDLQDILQTNKI
eukprot:TRINITY_DN9494_c0_g2_i1.p1 TRINITY_DN9494_c0_g2~~TRINITY_DN9494_c0_g2_i1.p1  ORF type:complete len:317 (+),score=73.05 TRINITY_DN9494_c0_g2_i1:1-951(+)